MQPVQPITLTSCVGVRRSRPPPTPRRSPGCSRCRCRSVPWWSERHECEALRCAEVDRVGNHDAERLQEGPFVVDGWGEDRRKGTARVRQGEGDGAIVRAAGWHAMSVRCLWRVLTVTVTVQGNQAVSPGVGAGMREHMCVQDVVSGSDVGAE